jgi:hypothetical protein
MPTTNRFPLLNVWNSLQSPAQKLALAIGITTSCVVSLNGQETSEEPPRIFRGGIVQQLRSLTEETFQTQRAETKKPPSRTESTNTKEIDRPVELPKPPALNSVPRPAVTSQNSRPATSNNNAPRTSSDSVGNGTGAASRHTKLPPVVPPAYRSTETGKPEANTKATNDSRFRYKDNVIAPSDDASASIPPSASTVRNLEETASFPLSAASDEVHVAEVEAPPVAPKVSRRPLPSSSVAKSTSSTVADPTSSPAPKPNPQAAQTKSVPQPQVLEQPMAEQFALPSLPNSSGQLDLPPSNDVGFPTLPTAIPLAVPAPNRVQNPLSMPSSSYELGHPPVSLPGNKSTPPAQTANTKPSSPSQNANPIRAQAGGQAEGEHLSMESPRLQVLLKGPGSLAVGTPVEYQLLVRNQDSISLDGIICRLEIPADVTFQLGKPSHGNFETERNPDGTTLLTWTFDQLAAQRTATAPMELVAKNARNFAVAMDWTLMPKSGEAHFEVRQARLELTLEGPSEVEFGVPNSYRLNVRNPGTAVASNVKVNLGAASFGSSEAEIGEIQPGEQQSIDVELTFHEKGIINIKADASGAGNLQSTAKVDVLVKQAQMAVQLVGVERAYHGTIVNYEAKLQNTGNLEGRDVRAVVTLPSGVEVINKSQDATLTGDQLVWNIASVKPGQSFTLPFQLQMRSAGEHQLSLNCAMPRSKPITAYLTTTVESIADLKLVVNDPIAPAPVGGVVAYELSITNRGSRAAMNVKIIGQFSEGIEPTQADGAKHRLVPGQVIFDPIATIAAGETKILKIYAKADKPGTHRFRAEVKSDESDLRLVQEETTQYLESSPSRIATPMSDKVTR